jgi:hypothetical protein
MEVERLQRPEELAAMLSGEGVRENVSAKQSSPGAVSQDTAREEMVTPDVQPQYRLEHHTPQQK